MLEKVKADKRGWWFKGREMHRNGKCQIQRHGINDTCI